MKNYERMLKALANRRRLAILRYLRREKEARVGTIAAAIKLSFKATSRHLQQLTAVDILERDQRGLEMWYRIVSERISHCQRKECLLTSLIRPNKRIRERQAVFLSMDFL